MKVIVGFGGSLNSFEPFLWPQMITKHLCHPASPLSVFYFFPNLYSVSEWSVSLIWVRTRAGLGGG